MKERFEGEKFLMGKSIAKIRRNILEVLIFLMPFCFPYALGNVAADLSEVFSLMLH